MGLDRLESRSVEPHGGVKGGSAAAQRVPLTPPWGSNTTGQAIKAPTYQKCVRDVSEHLSDMSPGYTVVPAIHALLAQAAARKTWMPATSAGITVAR
jgi:hypothetical protein